ncbi:MAG: serine acetyltransferase [Ruminococcus sp.]|nr:serine acetyltransferase [Ruminococcus sp.]
MNEINDRIEQLAETLMEDYKGGRSVDEIKHFNHPEREAVVDILEKLRRLVFPGYFRSRGYRFYTIRNNTTTLLEDVIFNLIKQITLVLPYREEFAEAEAEALNREAERITFEFLGKLPMIREYIETDIQAAYDGDPAAYSKDEIIFSYPGLYAILTSRIAHELFLLGVPLIPRMMTEHAHSLTGIDIHPGVTLGKYFFIDHGTGIVIGETTVIGNNVKVYQGVTLGALSTRGGQSLRNKKRHPTIKDNVTIYSGASILGGDTVVGKDAVIGGNAFITSSVPDGARVSIKTQELVYSFGSKKEQEKVDFENADNWFYTI